jgi:phage terminase Nu1 subunit (DNA packaging protein)
MPSFLSDVEKLVPAIEDFLTLVEQSEFGSRMQELHEMVRKSRKGAQKLKKKPFSPIETAGQLEIEVREAQAILGAIDGAERKMKQKLEKLDSQKTMEIAVKIVKGLGFQVEGQQLPSFEKITERIIPTFRLAILVAMSVALASLLDPLEAVTRYPDSQHASFDQNHPYVLNFKGLSNIISCILDKATESGRSEEIL